MGRYGDVAVQAADLMHSWKREGPGGAWEQAAAAVIPARLRASREEGCLRSAFLGLCVGFIQQG